ncbi:MAG: MoaF-related domain-containing protein [Cyclobacteriaceae bacterium]
MSQKLQHFIVGVLTLLLMKCAATSAESITLIDRTIVYQYDEAVYHLTFDTDSTLHWEAMQGSELGLRGTEVYIAEWITVDKLFITWGEESGTGVSQVLDFEKGTVVNHLIFGRSLYAGDGTIKFLDDN